MKEHLSNIVVCGLIVRDGKIFVARRAATKVSWPDRYEIVGGHVDPGEQLEDALVREIQEEIGVTVRVGRIVDAFTYDSRDDDMFKIEICYFCYLEDGVEPVLNPADHSEGRWIGSDEIELIEKDDEETVALRKAFKILEGAEE